jgi:hypothetical protein
LRSHGLGRADLEAIERGTALRLFPRFAKAANLLPEDSAPK